MSTPGWGLWAAVANEELDVKFHELPTVVDGRFTAAVRAAISDRRDFHRTELEQLLRLDDAPQLHRLAAFYGLLHGARRLRDPERFKELVHAHASTFPDQPLVQVLRAESLALDDRDETALRAALSLSRRTQGAYAGRGVFCLTAETILKLHALGQATPIEMDEARAALDRAHAIDPAYAKVHALGAQLDAAAGRFDHAQHEIARAIAKESSEGIDYDLRLLEYSSIRNDLRVAQQLRLVSERSSELEKQSTRLASELSDIRAQMLEALGLLAAIVAFTVTAAQISTDLTFGSAARLMFVLGGVLILVLGAFAITLRRGELRLREMAPFMVGLGMTVLPLIFWPTGLD